MKHTPLALGLGIAVAAAALATADPSKPPKPQPTDPKLAQLVGRWQGKTVLTIRGERFDMTTTFHCERAVVGPPVTCTAIAVGGGRRLEEVHLYGYDRASDTYHLFSVNNWGEAYDHAAKWTKPHTVSFVHIGTRDGKPLREEYNFDLRPDQITLAGTISLDGKIFAEGVSTVTRVR